MRRIIKLGPYLIFAVMFNSHAQESNTIKQYSDVEQGSEQIQSVVELIDDQACDKLLNETDKARKEKLETDCEKIKQAQQ